MTFQIKPATRQGVRPLIGLYAESGCGKTFTSLLLARGFVGPSGKIVLADTESGRGSLYADVIAGGYDVLEIGPPFSPAAHIEAVELVERSGAHIGILDSGSHEWEGISGVLDMASTNEENSKCAGLHNWKTPKMEHAKFLLRLLQSSIPWIICLRAKYKTRQIRDEKGKTQIIKDDAATPIQAEDFIYEMTAHGQIMPDHSLRLTKCSHPALRSCFPDNKPVEIKHGESLAKWCASPGVKPSVQSSGNSSGVLLAKLRDLTSGIHGFKTGMPAADWTVRKSRLTQWLYDENVLSPDKSLDNLTHEELVKLIDKVQTKLDVPMP